MKSKVRKSQSQVLKMPGVHCALYAAGHCLYEERLNPEYEADWRCTELLRYMALYDTLVDQADRFSLSEHEMTALWEKRIAAVPSPGDCCPSYAPVQTGCSGCSKCGPADPTYPIDPIDPARSTGSTGSRGRNADGTKAAEDKQSPAVLHDASTAGPQTDPDVEYGVESASAQGPEQDHVDVRREVGIDFSSALGCLFALDSACVLRMPVCDGVCGRFLRRNG